MRSPYFRKFNANPFKKNLGDCAIRATSAALFMKYKDVCKHLHVAYKEGHGLIRDTGIDVYDIQDEFSDYFDIVENLDDDNQLENRPEEFDDFQDDFYDEESGLTLNDFCELYAGQGVFLVGLKQNKRANNPQAKREGGHIVAAFCMKGGKFPFFVDTWDSGELLVDSFCRVKKMVDKDSPERLPTKGS